MMALENDFTDSKSILINNLRSTRSHLALRSDQSPLNSSLPHGFLSCNSRTLPPSDVSTYANLTREYPCPPWRPFCRISFVFSYMALVTIISFWLSYKKRKSSSLLGSFQFSLVWIEIPPVKSVKAHTHIPPSILSYVLYRFDQFQYYKSFTISPTTVRKLLVVPVVWIRFLCISFLAIWNPMFVIFCNWSKRLLSTIFAYYTCWK